MTITVDLPAPPGTIAQFDTAASDLIADFFLNLSNTANAGDANRPNPVMQWGYNLAPGGGPMQAGETAFGFGLEGNYVPSIEHEYNEAHLYFVDKTGAQHRPWSWRINKDDFTDWTHLVHTSSTFWLKPGTEDVYASLHEGSFTLLIDGIGSPDPHGVAIQGFGPNQGVVLSKLGTQPRDFVISGFLNHNIGGVQIANGSINAPASIYAPSFVAADAVQSTSAVKVGRAEPNNPLAGQSVSWLSNGEGAGDEGDLMIKINVGGVIKTATLVDYSTI